MKLDIGASFSPFSFIRNNDLIIMKGSSLILILDGFLSIQKLCNEGVYYASIWNWKCSSLSGTVEPAFIKCFRDFFRTYLYYYVNYDNLAGIAVSGIPSLIVTMNSFHIEKIDVSFVLKEFITRISIPNGCCIHGNNLTVKNGYSLNIVAIPKIVIKSLYMPQSDDLKNSYWVEVFKFEGALLLKKFHYMSDWKSYMKNQESFLRKHDIAKSLNQFIQNPIAQDPVNEFLTLNLPLYFTKEFVENFMRGKKTDFTETSSAGLPSTSGTIFQNDPLFLYLPIYLHNGFEEREFQASEEIDFKYSDIIYTPKKISIQNESEREANIIIIDLKESVNISVTSYSERALQETLNAFDLV